MQLNMLGTWIEPLFLKDFAIVDPNFGIDILLTRTAPPIPKEVRAISWSATIYYKRHGSWPVGLYSRLPAGLPLLTRASHPTYGR